MTALSEATFRNFLSEEDGANWYAYVGNDPVNFVDEYGLFTPETVWDAINVGIGIENTKQAIKDGRIQDAVVAGAGTLYDIAAAATPLLPGGASTIIKALETPATAAAVANDVDSSIDNFLEGNPAEGIIDAAAAAIGSLGVIPNNPISPEVVDALQKSAVVTDYVQNLFSPNIEQSDINELSHQEGETIENG